MPRERSGTGIYIAQADGSDVRRVVSGATSRIEIRNARTGALRRTVIAAGHEQAIALSRSIVAVLGGDGLGERLVAYARASGARLGTWTVPRNIAPELSAAGKNVVFRTGRTIWLLELSTRSLRQLAIAKAKPIGLSIEGERVVWAENLRGRARIRSISLQAR